MDIPQVDFSLANLGALRGAMGLKQTKVATSAGISAPYLCSIEKGKQVPSFDTLTSIATAMGLTLGQLLYGCMAIEGPVYPAPF